MSEKSALPPPTNATESGQRLTNPSLGATLSADYEALKNDLVQANQLAVDFQRQLAGKSNEFAELKQLFEKTQNDLAHFQKNIIELRQERHRLANEAMRAVAYEIKIKDMTAERSRLQAELEAARQALVLEVQTAARQARERTAHIAELTLELEAARQSGTNRLPAIEGTTVPSSPEMESALIDVAKALERLTAALGSRPVRSSSPVRAASGSEPAYFTAVCICGFWLPRMP